jgi:iron complex outermembrane receptor protein
MQFLSRTGAIRLVPALAAAFTLATPALGDEAAIADSDTIVVTADLQAQVAQFGPLGTLDILSTPFSINSVTSDTIELRQTRTLIELQKTDPSAQFLFDGFGAPVIAIRGFQAQVRLDGAPSSVASQFPLEFVDRIDIVKGASSFLYGVVPPGGVVDYALKRPTDQAFVAGALSYRTDSNFLGRVDINQPLGSTLGLRVNALYEGGQDYLQDNVQSRVAVSAALDWRPTDTLLFSGDYTFQQNAPLSGGNATVVPLPGAVLPDPLNPSKRYLQEWERLRVNLYAYGLSAAWTFAPEWTLSAMARGFEQPRSYYSSGGQSLDADGLLTNSIFAFNDAQNSYLQQIRLAGRARWGETVHNLTIAGQRQLEPTYTGTGFGFSQVGPYTIANPINVPRPDNFALPDDPTYRNGRTLQTSVTIADSIDWNDWTLLAAVRYVDFDQQAYDAAGTTLSNYALNRWTPTVGLLRRIGDDWSVYASFAQGLETGVTPPPTPDDPSPTPLPPVTSDQYELGAKAQLFGNVTFSAAVFLLNRDYQGATFADDGITPVFVSDGRQQHTGVEANLSGAVAPGWNVIAGVTWLDAVIKDAAGTAINNATPPGISKFQATLFVEHEVASGLFLNGGLFHASSREIDLPNDRTIPGYTTVDIGARYVREIAGNPWSVNASVTNLLNANYWGGYYLGVLSLSQPRQLKLTLSAGF